MKYFKDLILTGLCLLVALLLLELGLRGAGERFQASFYVLERERGYALRPGAEGWDVGENENYVRISSRGLRDREHALKRPDKVVRVAVLGDSETEALQVPLEKAYFSVMERQLNSQLGEVGDKVEVINFGVGGYGLGPQYLTLKEEIWKYDPQIVLVVTSVDSVIRRSSRRMYPGDSFGAPFFVLRQGRLELDAETVARRATFVSETSRQIRIADLMNQSRFLSLVNSAKSKAAINIRQMKAPFQAAAHGGASSVPLDEEEMLVFQGPTNPALKDAWTLGETLILAMQNEAIRHHGEFWLVILDTPPQVDPDLNERAQWQQRASVDSLFRCDQALSDFAAKAGILHLDLAPELALLASERHLLLHGFNGMPRNTGHLNETGHLAVGQLIARTLRMDSYVLSTQTSWAAR
jgi:hypothetical protein